MTDLFQALTRGDVSAVAAVLQEVDEPGRRVLGDELVAHVRQRRDNWWAHHEATALAVAAVGTLSTATKVAALLGRSSVMLTDADPAPVVNVARQRGVGWLADLAHRLAERIPRSRPWEGWHFIAELLLAEKAVPPTGDAFVAGWAHALWWRRYDNQHRLLLDRLRADPFLDTVLPRLFEVDGIGTDLAYRGVGHSVPSALATLATEGRLDRALLLDGVLGRLLRGDRPGALRPFLALHELLTPTGSEVTARASAYLRLLADAPGPVAAAAQRTLRTVGDGVELAALLDTSRIVLTRPEKALVRGQLSWLDLLARQRPERAADIAEVLAVGADHAAADLRDRAVTLARRHGHQPPVAVTVVIAGDELPPRTPAVAALPPITDVDELVEEVSGLRDWPLASSALERVLDALVRLATSDRDRLATALLPVLRREQVGADDHPWAMFNVPAQLHGVLLAAAASTDVASRHDQWSVILSQLSNRSLRPFRGRSPVEPPRHSPLTLVLCARLAEIGQRMSGRNDPGLLAAPTSATGAIDPYALYDRLAALGERPVWRWDLTQALLRLPVGVDEALAARAAALGTAAGDELADWLGGDALPTPVHRVVTVRSGTDDLDYHPHPARRTVVSGEPPEGVADPLGLLTVPAQVRRGYNGWGDLWPALLPGHRGLVAAHLLPEFARSVQEETRDVAGFLPALAECTGPGGPALDLALAYGLCARHEVDRVATLDALLMLAAAGDLDAPGVGGRLGALAADRQVTVTRAMTPLRDAVTAGARLSVWRLLAAALPPLLAAPTPPRGTPDLLSLAAETAHATGVPVEVPGLADVVARGGTSRLVTEARRLAAAVAS
ncbi:hypothetical protein O7631_19095 [Micromonospora sp. WMMD967]|uniref:hypothetical protein n=1 Tax=Micromonospora sp. WMMD967 TaxID=3016101 RepID=UPI002415CD5B|nr:hypothetical protein [Micromonospora sp. WMMD967]MDG4838623.1 hypothetical protein [Micromonospora sp. WMMD967]